MKDFFIATLAIAFLGLAYCHLTHDCNTSTEQCVSMEAQGMGEQATEGFTFDDLLDAIEWVESKGIATAVGDNGEAVGAYQIHKAYVDDVNRIQKQWKSVSTGRSAKTFKYEDRLDSGLSRYMTEKYLSYWIRHADLLFDQDKYSAIDIDKLEAMARIHNGGPDGWKKESTKVYWKKIRARMESVR